MDSNDTDTPILYGYTPSLHICVLFVVLFGITTSERHSNIYGFYVDDIVGRRMR
jgi:hypothetical protein